MNDTTDSIQPDATTRLLVMLCLLAALGSCQPIPAPSSPTPSITAPATQLAIQTIPTVTPPPTTAITTPSPLPHPSPTVSPILEDQGLAHYLTEIWPGEMPQWAREPPEDREVVIRGSWGMSCTVLLRDRAGNVLAEFSQREDNWGDCAVLWSRSKELAVVAFWWATSTPMYFLVIDRHGKQHSDLLSAYYWPVWSPTEDLLAYQATSGREGRLFIINGDGIALAVSAPLSPRFCSACGTLPQWSPDGSKVAVLVETGEVTATPDIILCIAQVDGMVFQMSLVDYRPNVQQVAWLDNSHLLMQGTEWGKRRYFVFDNEMKTVREITSSLDLTPIPSSGERGK